MKMPAKVTLIIGGIIVGIVFLGYIPIWREDARARESRIRVYQLISVGEDLNKAEDKLKNKGFKLWHDEPIAPTVNKDYLQQIVIVGNTLPNNFESFSYASGWWMPFTHSESPYVIINATLEGIITEIE
jgi:hypothetical protein